MDTQQVQTAPSLLAQRESSSVKKVTKEEKSTFRHQIDDLIFGSVRTGISHSYHLLMYIF